MRRWRRRWRSLRPARPGRQAHVPPCAHVPLGRLLETARLLRRFSSSRRRRRRSAAALLLGTAMLLRHPPITGAPPCSVSFPPPSSHCSFPHPSLLGNPSLPPSLGSLPPSLGCRSLRALTRSARWRPFLFTALPRSPSLPQSPPPISFLSPSIPPPSPAPTPHTLSLSSSLLVVTRRHCRCSAAAGVRVRRRPSTFLRVCVSFCLLSPSGSRWDGEQAAAQAGGALQGRNNHGLLVTQPSHDRGCELLEDRGCNHPQQSAERGLILSRCTSCASTFWCAET